MLRHSQLFTYFSLFCIWKLCVVNIKDNLRTKGIIEISKRIQEQEEWYYLLSAWDTTGSLPTFPNLYSSLTITISNCIWVAHPSHGIRSTRLELKAYTLLCHVCVCFFYKDWSMACTSFYRRINFIKQNIFLESVQVTFWLGKIETLERSQSW